MKQEPQYDQLANDYRLVKDFDLDVYCYQPTLVKFAGNLTGKTCVDLACGSGQSTELIKENCDPESIIGIDISAKSIEIANDREGKNNLGIDYFVGDITTFDFSKFEPFDIATAWFLLHYAPSREDLETMCKNIYSCLKPGGRFVTVVANPEATDVNDENLGVSYKVEDPAKEWSIRWFDYKVDGKTLGPFKTFNIYKSTHIEALHKAGFQDITFSDPFITKGGLEKRGIQFWRQFITTPYVLMLTCEKPV